MPQAHAKFEYALWKSHSDQLHMCISQICKKPMNLSAVVLLYYPETCDGEDLVQTTWTVPVCDGDSGVLKIRVFLAILKKIFVSHQRCSTDLDVSNFVLT